MFKSLPTLGPVGLISLFSLILVIFYNASSWSALAGLVPLRGFYGGAFFVSFGIFLWAAFTLLLMLVSFRFTLKPVLMLIALISSGAMYFMSAYGISIDGGMVQNVFETDFAEAFALFNGTLLGYLLLFGVVPALLIGFWPMRYPGFFRGWLNRILMIVGCLCLIAAMVGSFYSTYAPVLREEDKLTHFINPTNYIYALGKYVRQRLDSGEREAIEPIGLDARVESTAVASSKKSLLVLVVGETARADHFALNGYERDTNPELSSMDIVNFPQVHSCGTSTAVSVPCMFSHFSRKDYSDKKGRTYENLLDILQRVGVQVLWLENNSDCKGVCLRVPTWDVPALQQNNPLCSNGACLDEAMLVGLPEYIAGLHDNAVIVLHSMGSHGPEYYKRYPQDMEHFTPVCRTNQLGSCSHDALVNVYDNTIRYTDHFLARLIELLNREAGGFNTMVWYLSDHGESLGENGVYLHGAPYALAPAAQTHIPMLMWFSGTALPDWHLDAQCLSKQRDKAFTQDNLFHSVLGLMQIRTALYQPRGDMFAACRK